MAITFKAADRKGYPQVEPNHLSAPRDGGVYGQRPAKAGIDVLYQGQFVVYGAEDVSFDGKGVWCMVYNEEQVYDERERGHAAYAMHRYPDTSYGGGNSNYDHEMYPRVFRLSRGDLYTTNCVADGTYEVGDTLTPGADGILEAGTGTNGKPTLQVVKEYTLPDGQAAVKLQVIDA